MKQVLMVQGAGARTKTPSEHLFIYIFMQFRLIFGIQNGVRLATRFALSKKSNPIPPATTEDGRCLHLNSHLFSFTSAVPKSCARQAWSASNEQKTCAHAHTQAYLLGVCCCCSSSYIIQSLLHICCLERDFFFALIDRPLFFS